MAMSRDRVHFNLPEEMCTELSPVSKAATAAATVAFGLTYQEMRSICMSRTRVICRPSQFARFMILRNLYGGRNSFKELNAEIVPAITTPPEIDVSKRPNTYGDQD